MNETFTEDELEDLQWVLHDKTMVGLTFLQASLVHRAERAGLVTIHKSYGKFGTKIKVDYLAVNRKKVEEACTKNS